MGNLDERTVILWKDDCKAANNLSKKLRDCGYSVKEMYSRASKPVAQYGSNFFVGYSEIYSLLN